MDAEARLLHAPSGLPRVDASECGSIDGHAVSVSHASAKRLRRSKRMLTAVGLGGVYLIWAFFAWVIFVRAQTLRRALCAISDASSTMLQTYGSLVFKLLGPATQDSFATSFGVSYGVGAAAEWKDILQQVVQTIIIMAIVERLHLTNSVSWLEEHIDYMSTQALLFEHVGLTFVQQTRLFTAFRTRLSD